MEMKNITEISGTAMKTLAQLMESLRGLSYLQIRDGQVAQQIGEDTFLSADLTSLVGGTTLHLMNDQQQVKSLKVMDAGSEVVEVYENAEDYHFVGGHFDLPVSRYEALVGRDEVPNIEGTSVFTVSFEAKSAVKKSYKSLIEGKGPSRFDFDNEGNCTRIVNNHGGELRLKSQKMIPASHRDVMKEETVLKLHSFWLHELKGAGVDLKIIQVESDPDNIYSGGFDYWLNAEVVFASGVYIKLLEKLLLQLY